MSLSLLDEIKIEIRSLLISSQTGLSEEELGRDYAFFNSQHSLPYEQFGYLTRTDFLNSLTDVLYRSSDGLIHPIVNQSTEHIFQFVQQQRPKKTKKLSIPSKYPSIQPFKKRTVPSMVMSPFQAMYSTAATNKVIEKKRTFSRLKPVIPQFERINVTNEFLQRLLTHFRQQEN